jgi:hypothetical protein
MIGISLLLSNPLLISHPVVRGLVVANGKDGAPKPGGKARNSYPYGSMRVQV